MTTPMPEPLLPLFLRLDGKDVLVVGAGPVAERKIEDLVNAGARVRVVAKSATPAVASMPVSLTLRPFEPADIDRAWLVIAATSDPDTQKTVCDLAAARQIFAVAIDDPPNGSAYSASVLRRGPFTVAISSSGEAPALSRLLREVIEQALPADDWIDAARALRETWKRDGTPMASRFPDLVRAFKDRAK